MSERPEVQRDGVTRSRSAAATPLDALAALDQIVDVARELGRERTARARIGAYAETEIVRIKTAEAVLKDYFEKIFVERRSNFGELFSRLDAALEQRDGATVNDVLRGIVDIARSSPLADLGDLSQIRAALDDPDQVWEL